MDIGDQVRVINPVGFKSLKSFENKTFVISEKTTAGEYAKDKPIMIEFPDEIIYFLDGYDRSFGERELEII